MIVVLGGGESGVYAAILAKERGYEVIVSDSSEIHPKYKALLQAHRIPYEEGGHRIEENREIRLAIKSPGIPTGAQVVQQLKARGVELISEVEWAYRHCRGALIGVTGSNGKTTVVSMIAHILKQSGIATVPCGNIGFAFSRAVVEHPEASHYVVELSSFQLEDIDRLHARWAAITNITPDHLKRYGGSFERYVEAKMHLLDRMKSQDLFVHGPLPAYARTLLSQRRPMPRTVEVPLPEEGTLWLGPSEVWEFDPRHLPGRHNALNASIAAIICRDIGCNREQILDALESYRLQPHRLERVVVWHDIEVVNDSKATNVESVRFALEAQKRPVVWIAGGLDKGNDYEVIKDIVRQKVKTLVPLGKDVDRLRQAFEGMVPVTEQVTDMCSAVERAFELAEAGDVILLSPACASFDLFRNYEHRGECFKRCVYDFIQNREKHTTRK